MSGKTTSINARNILNITGVTEGRETVTLNSAELTGNGIIKGPKIYIKTKKFSFTGTIECSEECLIITEEPCNQTMFKRLGKGKFIFQEAEKPFYISL